MSAPALSRTEWEQHENFPAHVLLLGSHANFKRISQHLIAQAETGAAAVSIGFLYDQWISAMRSHEGYEERKLYPYLARRWGCSFEAAEKGHHELHAADDVVRAALSARDGAALARALREHDRVLVAHLREEEDQVIPLLLHLERDEFDELTSNPPAVLLARLKARGF